MKLTAKILIAQLVAIVVALGTIAWLIDWRTGIVYRGYLSQAQSAQLAALAEQVAQQYAASGNWQTVQQWLDQSAAQTAAGQMGRQMGGHMPSNGMGMGMMARAENLYLLVDPASGQSLTDPTTTPLDAAALANGAPVVVNGITVARIVSLRGMGHMGSAEENVLAQVQTAILLSAAVAGVIALAIGALLVTSILRPLAAVEATVMDVAKGNFGARVAVRGQDEIANLGSAVNHMAETLQAQETLRQRLVSDVAHELRTPISVIQGNLQAILDGVYPLNTDEIRTLYDETQLLSRLVTDLHELAQAEAGRLPLQRQLLSVQAILQHLSDLYAPLAKQKGIDLRVDLPANSPASRLQVNADPDRLQQILHNLLGNAIRHTPSGETIQVSARIERDEPGKVRFTLQDTGSGIAAEDLPYVFDRFYRGEANRPRPVDHAAGAGLGLAIAKALVQAHGGQIGVYATTPHGATFWFTLPATEHAAST